MSVRVIQPSRSRAYINLPKIVPGENGRVFRAPNTILIEGGRRISGASREDTDAPLVSVVSACRNAEKTIQAAVDSVHRQTYKNIEHIVVDGSSIDRTIDIIAANSDHIEYFVSEPDRGVYAALNKAITLAQGDYVAVLSADDHFFPTFIEQSLSALEKTGADISFCDYITGDGAVHCPDLNDSVLFLQLGIGRSTFLIRRSCFEQIGGFDEQYKVVADAKWNRAAYLAGMKFTKLEGEPLVFCSSQGPSSSGTVDLQDAAIDESARLIVECFKFLDHEEAECLHRSNFGTRRLIDVHKLYKRYALQHPLFKSALREYLRFNLGNRPAYLTGSDEPQPLCTMIDLCEEMDFPLTMIRFERPDDPVRAVLATLTRLAEDVSAQKLRCVLHFARKFSAPSEPFIPATIKELALRQPESRHIVLCDERALELERPFSDLLCVPWGKLDGELRSRLYDLIWTKLNPELIVAHSALDGYWLYRRLNERQKFVPTINMCHGIDVFSIEPESACWRYITEYAAISSRVCFTAGSNYLRDLLIARSGIAGSKVFLVNNVVTETLFAHRKTDDCNAGHRPLRVLSVVGLIASEEHDILIRALARAKKSLPHGFILTIVYGDREDRIFRLERMARELGIAEAVQFLPLVDLNEEAAFHAQFDLYVLPSTLSGEDLARTERSGVALLEAIAAGLPVATTNARRRPEVVGQPNDHAMVVPGCDVDALAEAIVHAVANHARVFMSNAPYAQEHLAEFSTETQYRQWSEAEAWVLQKRPKIYHFSAITRGGAPAATLNIHKELLRHGYDSVFVTRDDQELSPYVPNVVRLSPEMSFDFDQAQVKDSLKHRFTLFSIDDHIISNETICSLVADADIVNFAWFTQFISSDNIAAVTRMGKPVVITLRDMNPITGGCHYFHGCEEWQRTCEACPQLQSLADDFPHFVLRNKSERWNKSAITFIALSEHSRAILAKSVVAAGARIERISNFVDHRVFYLESRERARAALNISKEAFVIGYLPSFNSLVKGHDQLVAALKRLKELRPDRKVLVALAAKTALPAGTLAFDVLQVGKIHDPQALRAFYNAVDVVAVPSLEETFSNTTAEALACGAPVVGFRTGILEELLADERLGAAVPVGDCEGLAYAFARLCDSGSDRTYCNKVVTEKYSVSGQTAKYDELFKSLISDRHIAPDVDQESPSQVNLASSLNAKRAVRKAEGAKRMLAKKQSDFDSDFDKLWVLAHSSLFGQLRQVARTVLGRRDGADVNAILASAKKYRSRVPKDIPTPPNFDDETYLANNPDVRQAVARKKIRSGYYHYLKSGRFEGRPRATKKSRVH